MKTFIKSGILLALAAVLLFTGCTSMPASVSSSSFSESASAPETGVFLPDNVEYTWETELVGWAKVYGEPEVYRTVDGGETWVRTEIDIPAEMYYEPLESIGTWIERAADETLLVLGSSRLNMPYGASLRVQYDFIFDDILQKWVWNEPDWELPNGLNRIEFIDYVQFYLFPPVEHNASEGLDDLNTIMWLVFNTAEFEEHKGRSLTDKTVPYSLIDKMAGYFYGDYNFSSIDFRDDFDIYMVGNDKGFVYEGHWPRGELESYTIQSVNILEDGKIEAILFHNFYDGEAGVAWASGVTPDPLYQRCIFEPVEVEGVRLFTLLSSEIVDKL